MLQISNSLISLRNEKLHSYNQYTEGCAIRTASISSLLAKTMFTWFGDNLSTEPVKITDLVQKHKIADSHKDFFTALLLILQRAGYLSEENGSVYKLAFDSQKLDETVEVLNRQGLEFYEKGQWLQDAIGPNFDLARVCIPKLPEVLRDEISGVQLLFSPDNYSRTMATYSNHLQEVYYSLIAEQIIEKCHKIWALEPNRQIRILEIGAGSGKGSLRMLEGLREYGKKVHYCFTDIGNSFLRRAKKTFKNFDCELDFRFLDISKPPSEQGFENNSFDIVFATNVLHATPDLRVTIGNSRDLLASEGTIFINEISNDLPAITVAFGTTPGWWLHSDGLRLPYSPVASTTTFRKILPEIGFKEVTISGYPGVPENELTQAIIQGVKKSSNHG